MLAGLATGATGTACRSTPDGTATPVDRGTVVEVVDGDTVVLRIGDRAQHVRLLGIDTPETVHPDRPVECHGPESSALLHELLPVGTEVLIGRDAQARDPYDRLLLYVVRADGLFVNEALVLAGAADVLVIEPNGALADRLRAAAAEARAEGRGLWGSCGGPHEAGSTGSSGAAVPFAP